MWPLKRGSNHKKIVYDRTRKWWPFNTGDCLLEVTTWAGLTVYLRSVNCFFFNSDFVTDFDFSPFDDCLLATGSSDNSVSY